MSSASSAELIAAALASVEDRIQQQIEAARARREREQQQRQELAAARKAGLARRHAARLRQQASRGDTPTTAAVDRVDIDTTDGPTVAQTAAVARSSRDLINDRPPPRSSVTDDQPADRRWSSSSLTRARGGGHAGTPE